MTQVLVVGLGRALVRMPGGLTMKLEGEGMMTLERVHIIAYRHQTPGGSSP